MTAVLPEIETTQLPPDPLLIVEVTEQHIRIGTPGNGARCAIAQALLSLGMREVRVSGTQAQWRGRDGLTYWADLPLEAQQFINRYDGWGKAHRTWICAPGAITFSIEPQRTF